MIEEGPFTGRKKKEVLLSWRNMFATLLKQTLSGPLLPFLPLRRCVCTSACVNVTHSRWSLVGASCAKKDTSNYRFWSRLRQLPIPKIYPSQNCLSSKFGSIRTSPAVWADFKKKKRGALCSFSEDIWTQNLDIHNTNEVKIQNWENKLTRKLFEAG